VCNAQKVFCLHAPVSWCSRRKPLRRGSGWPATLISRLCEPAFRAQSLYGWPPKQPREKAGEWMCGHGHSAHSGENADAPLTKRSAFSSSGTRREVDGITSFPWKDRLGLVPSKFVGCSQRAWRLSFRGQFSRRCAVQKSVTATDRVISKPHPQRHPATPPAGTVAVEIANVEIRSCASLR